MKYQVARYRVSKSKRRELELRARELRGRMTESESKVWEAIRAERLGVRFRRQVLIGGRFIVDFAAARERLVVEVDGGYHVARRQGDRRRDKLLGELGWRVLRLEAEFVVRELPAAVEQIRRAIE